MSRFIRLLCSVCLLLLAGSAAGKTVVVVSAEWAGLTAADGSGLYFDVMREAFATEDIQLHIRVTNWKRAKQMFYANRADILLADYADAHPRYQYPQWHLDMDAPVLLFSRAALPSVEAIKGKTVGWRLGYDFDQLLPVPVVGIEVETEQIGFELLRHGRLDAFVGYASNKPSMQQGMLSSRQLMPARKLYPVFNHGFSSRQLAAAFDRGMQRLHDSGRLAQLFGPHFGRAGFAEQP